MSGKNVEKNPFIHIFQKTVDLWMEKSCLSTSYTHLWIA